LEVLEEGSMLGWRCELEEAMVRVTEKCLVDKGGRREKGSEES
jgi:hypothetical protein